MNANDDTLTLHEKGAGRWYVTHCKPFKEACAADILREHLGLEVYLAEVNRRVRGEMKMTPFFPSYIFVNADLAEVKLSAVNSTPGVVRLLEFGGGPQPLPNGMLEAIRGVVEKVNNGGGVLPHSFRPGDHVMLKSGPYRGLEAVFLGPTTPSARVKVLLQFLGRPHELKVEVDVLERTYTPSAHKRERGTRGKGRKIDNGIG